MVSARRGQCVEDARELQEVGRVLEVARLTSHERIARRSTGAIRGPDAVSDWIVPT
jgi:hypothetical protein